MSVPGAATAFVKMTCAVDTKSISTLLGVLGTGLALFSAGAVGATDSSCDVVVYGGTSAGVVAAVQVARMGGSVVLVEPGRRLGGLSSGGLGMTDSGDHAAIGGISREFYRRVKRHYDDASAWKYEKRGNYREYDHASDAIWRFEPNVAERVFEEMLDEARVTVVRGERLDLKRGVVKRGKRIVAIVMESRRRFYGSVFIDATYEGDLMAKAGVSYVIGRESNGKYGETLNGVQTAYAWNHQFSRAVDPFIVPGKPSSGLLPRILRGGPGREGSGDRRVQAYCYRMCLTDVPGNRVSFPKPEGYDSAQYGLLLRYLTTDWNDIFGVHQMMPNRKTDTNNSGAFGTDNIGMNYGYPDGDYAARARIIREHEAYQKGLMWFLANDPRVPEPVRARVNQWGLAGDEFVETGNWPHQLYIREARRMVSEYVMNENDCRNTRVTPESVGMGSYNLDSHHVQRYVDAEGHVRNEGDVEVHPGAPYRISYRSIRPRERECSNLLVPVCLSSSHIAYGSIRMEPVFMILGQSAATAAVQSIAGGVAVQRVEYGSLRQRLLADGQVLDMRGIEPGQLAGVVVDDDEAVLKGSWKKSNSTRNWVGDGYRHDEDSEKGGKTATFKATLPESGQYGVQVSYSAGENRADNVPVTVGHAAGETTVIVNERIPPSIDRLFSPLGRFRFDRSRPAVVVISNKGTNGHVIIDAVRFVK